MWDKSAVSLDGITLPITFSPAKDAVATVVGGCGLNTVNLWNKNEIDRLTAERINVITLGLDPKRNKNKFIAPYTNLATEFFFSMHSPVQTLCDPALPMHIVTHSTGGQLYLRASQTPGISHLIPLLYDSETHITPFLDAKHVSRNHSNPAFRFAYETYAKLHRDHTALQTTFGWTYLTINAWINGATVESTKNSPTYGEILHVQEGGRYLADHCKPIPCGNIPVTFVLGEKDAFACTDTTLDFVNNIGTDKIKVIMVKNGSHWPLKEDPKLLCDFIESVHVNAARKKAEELEARKFKEIVVPTASIDLSDRFGFALQRGASLLNAPTRFLKGLFGSGVGNPEVRGQSEGHALNTSHAFRLQ